MRKNYLKFSGLLALFTCLLHIIGGQTSLVQPLLDSPLENQAKGEWLGVWHMVTVLLLLTSIFILRCGFSSSQECDKAQLKSLAILYIASGIPFIISSLYYQLFLPQFILLIPIGLLILTGIRPKK